MMEGDLVVTEGLPVFTKDIDGRLPRLQKLNWLSQVPKIA